MSTVITIGSKTFHTQVNLKGTETQGLLINTENNSIHATLLGDFKPVSVIGQGGNACAVRLESATAHGGFDLYLLASEDNIISNHENIPSLESTGYDVTRFYRSRDNKSNPHLTLGVVNNFALFITERKSTIIKPLIGDIYETVRGMIDIPYKSSERNVFLFDNKLHG